MELNIQKVQVVWMGLRTNLGFLYQQRTGELERFIMLAASGDGDVGRPAGVRAYSVFHGSTLTM